MELGIGILIGLLIATLILIIEFRLVSKKTTITEKLSKPFKPSGEKAHIIGKDSTEDIIKLLKE